MTIKNRLRSTNALLPALLFISSYLAPQLRGVEYRSLISRPTFKVYRDCELDRIFRDKSDWVGGDAADSVSLGKDRVLWLFGDTLLGRIERRRRVIDVMIHNSLAIQKGLNPKNAVLSFFHGSKDGRPESMFHPESKQGWLWPGLGGIPRVPGFTFFLDTTFR